MARERPSEPLSLATWENASDENREFHEKGIVEEVAG
jgi:hypothetical protein